VPTDELLGLERPWVKLLPLPFEAPAIPPVTAPAAHTKVLPVEAVSGRVNEPHVDTVVAEVTTGVGFTVTVISVGDAARHDPFALGDVGRTE